MSVGIAAGPAPSFSHRRKALPRIPEGADTTRRCHRFSRLRGDRGKLEPLLQMGPEPESPPDSTRPWTSTGWISRPCSPATSASHSLGWISSKADDYLLDPVDVDGRGSPWTGFVDQRIEASFYKPRTPLAHDLQRDPQVTTYLEVRCPVAHSSTIREPNASSYADILARPSIAVARVHHRSRPVRLTLVVDTPYLILQRSSNELTTQDTSSSTSLSVACSIAVEASPWDT